MCYHGNWSMTEAELQQALAAQYPNCDWVVEQTIGAWMISGMLDKRYITIYIDQGNVRSIKGVLYYGQYVINRLDGSYWQGGNDG